MDKPRLTWIAKRLVKKVGQDDVSGSAAELAYRFFLAIFPFFIFLAALGGFGATLFNVDNPTGQVMDALGDRLPDDASSMLRTQLEGVLGQSNSGIMSISILGALWAASSGMGTVMKKTNAIYGVKETRPFLVKSGVGVGLTLAGAGLMLIAFALFVIGQIYGVRVAGELGFSGAMANLFTFARVPLALVIVLLAVAFLFWGAPNTTLPIKWLTPGAILFAVGWLVATLLFAFYVANFSSYNATYGALAGVVVMLIWFYMTSFLLLVGAELNVVLAEEFAPDTVEAATRDRREREVITRGRIQAARG